MRTVHEFTKKISDLLNAGLSLQQSLDSVSSMRGCSPAVRKASHSLAKLLEEGNPLSAAFRQCAEIDFPELYVSFISSCEENGKLAQTFSFLLAQEEKKSEHRNKILGVSVYPAFVVFAAFAGSILLLSFSDTLSPGIGTSDKASLQSGSFTGLVSANSFLVFAVAGLVFALRKIFSANSYLDVYRIIDFSLGSGMNLYDALKSALLCAGKNHGLKNKIICVLHELESGSPASHAFAKLGEKIRPYFETAERTGSLSAAVRELLCAEEKAQGGREKLCSDLIEPAVLCLIAVYIIILLKTVVSPLLFSYGIEEII